MTDAQPRKEGKEKEKEEKEGGERDGNIFSGLKMQTAVEEVDPLNYAEFCWYHSEQCENSQWREEYLAYWVPEIEQELKKKRGDRYDLYAWAVLRQDSFPKYYSRSFSRHNEAMKEIALIAIHLGDLETLQWLVQIMPDEYQWTIGQLTLPLLKQEKILLENSYSPEMLLYLLQTDRLDLVDYLLERFPEDDYTEFFLSLITEDRPDHLAKYLALDLPFDPVKVLISALNQGRQELAQLLLDQVEYPPFPLNGHEGEISWENVAPEILYQIDEREMAQVDPIVALQQAIRHESIPLAKHILAKDEIYPNVLSELLQHSGFFGRINPEIATLLIQAGADPKEPISLLTAIKVNNYSTMISVLERPHSVEELSAALDRTWDSTMAKLLLDKGAIPSDPMEWLIQFTQEGKIDSLQALAKRVTFTPEELDSVLPEAKSISVRFFLATLGATELNWNELLTEALRKKDSLALQELIDVHAYSPEELAPVFALPELSEELQLYLVKNGLVEYDPVELLTTQNPLLLKYLLATYSYTPEQLNSAAFFVSSFPLAELFQARGVSLPVKARTVLATTSDPKILRRLMAENRLNLDEVRKALVLTNQVEIAQLLVQRLTEHDQTIYVGQALARAAREGNQPLVDYYLSIPRLDRAKMLLTNFLPTPVVHQLISKLEYREFLDLLRKAIKSGNWMLVQQLLAYEEFSPAQLSRIRLEYLDQLLLAPDDAFLRKILTSDFFSPEVLDEYLGKSSGAEKHQHLITTYLASRNPTEVLTQARSNGLRYLSQALLTYFPTLAVKTEEATKAPPESEEKRFLRWVKEGKPEDVPEMELTLEMLNRGLQKTEDPVKVLLLLEAGATDYDPEVLLMGAPPELTAYLLSEYDFYPEVLNRAFQATNDREVEKQLIQAGADVNVALLDSAKQRSLSKITYLLSLKATNDRQALEALQILGSPQNSDDRIIIRLLTRIAR